MNEKEISEIRRRLQPEKNNITTLRGCYVNEKAEIISEFTQSIGLMPPEASEKILQLLKKTLTGALGKNLISLDFETQQVVSGQEHKLLMQLRSSKLKDDACVTAFFNSIAQTVTSDGSYVIFLAYDTYDVPYRTSEDVTGGTPSDEVFSYILCSICPLKQTKPALSYYIKQNEFQSIPSDLVISVPELGFIFPAFDDRRANIYSALHYTRDITDNHAEFIQSIFGTAAPMAAAEQKETFRGMLQSTLDVDCNLEVVQSLHEHIHMKVAEHKEKKETEPLTIKKHDVKTVLTGCGLPENRIKSFEEKFDEEFGDEGVPPKNIMESKTDIRIPDVVIKVNNNRGELVETRIINGIKYLLIRADEGVEVNGVGIYID